MYSKISFQITTSGVNNKPLIYHLTSPCWSFSNCFCWTWETKSTKFCLAHCKSISQTSYKLLSPNNLCLFFFISWVQKTSLIWGFLSQPIANSCLCLSHWLQHSNTYKQCQVSLFAPKGPLFWLSLQNWTEGTIYFLMTGMPSHTTSVSCSLNLHYLRIFGKNPNGNGSCNCSITACEKWKGSQGWSNPTALQILHPLPWQEEGGWQRRVQDLWSALSSYFTIATPL